MRQPLPHQKQIIEKTKDYDRFALYMSPGLGKTFTSLYTWYNYSNKNNLIVVTPPSLINQWEEETNKMGFDKQINIYKLNIGSKKSEKIIEDSFNDIGLKIFIVSYTSLKLIKGLFNFDTNDTGVIFDESHKVKNRKSQQSKTCVIIANRYNWIRLLTGTPMSIGWEDYFVPLKMLKEEDPRVKFIKNFKENFIIYDSISNFTKRSTYEVIQGYKNLDILEQIIKKKSLFIDEKSAGIKLPEMIEKTFYVEKDKEFEKAMRDRVFGTWMIKNSGSKLMAHRTGLSGFLYGQDMYGKRIVEKFKNQNKKQLLIDILEGLDGKILILYNFEQEKNDIIEVCKSLNKIFSEFRSDNIDKSGDILISNYSTLSLGHNLQEFTKVVYYSPTIVGTDFSQSKKRTNRMGQKNTCYYYYLITKNSLEEKIFEKIKNNEDYTEEMFEEDMEYKNENKRNTKM